MNDSASELVSVIIPTFNRAGMVIEAIDSVLRQEGGNFELIVVDDGSTDATSSILESRPGELRYVAQPHRGVSAARNLGARVARGSWLAFLDSDDLWAPRKLTTQRSFHRSAPHLPISQTDEIWIRRGTRVNPCLHHTKPEGDIFVPSLTRCLVSPSAVMMRRDLFESVGGFDESLAVCEDYDLWLRIARRVPFGLIAEPLVVKRGGHSDQLSRQFWGMDRFRVAALSKLLAAGEIDRERREAITEELKRKCAILSQGARRRERIHEAQRYEALARIYGDV